MTSQQMRADREFRDAASASINENGLEATIEAFKEVVEESQENVTEEWIINNTEVGAF